MADVLLVAGRRVLRAEPVAHRATAPHAEGLVEQALESSPPVLLLATGATVMADTGMTKTIAFGAANVTGTSFPLVSALVGVVGAFTTSANALFGGFAAPGHPADRRP